MPMFNPDPDPDPDSAVVAVRDADGRDDLNLPHPAAPQLVWRIAHHDRIRLHTQKGPRCDVTAIWACPVCDTPVHSPRRPGRRRVYCTNSCRQKAYRRRCKERKRIPMPRIVQPRPRRATTRDKTHAIREYRDSATGRRDSTGRGVTVCGVFARMSIDTPERFAHTRFTAATLARASTTCRRCEALCGLVPPNESLAEGQRGL